MPISPSIIRDGDKIRRVKNLGWLMRHWKDVQSFTVECTRNGAYIMGDDACYLRAPLRDGRTYETGWADSSVCWDWLDRPIFRGVELLWISREGIHHFVSCGLMKREPDTR